MIKSLFGGVLIALFIPSHAYANERQFGDWVLHCDTNNQTCSMSQIAVIEESGETLMQLNILLDIDANQNTAPPTAKAIIVLPLGTALDTAPKLYIANGFITNLQINYCLQDGCYYSIPLNEAMIERFLTMFSGYVEVRSKLGEQLKIPISGKGSRAAFNSYRERF